MKRHFQSTASRFMLALVAFAFAVSYAPLLAQEHEPDQHTLLLLHFNDNLKGEEIRTLANEQREAGYHSVRWEGKDNNGNAVVSGVYLYQLRAGDFSQMRKMSLLR